MSSTPRASPRASPRAPALHSMSAGEMFLPLLTHSPAVGFTVCDAAGRYVYVSPSMRSLTGFKPHEMLGRAAADFIAEEDQQALNEMLSESALRQRQKRPCEACTQFVRLQHRRAAGALLPVDVRTCTDGGDFLYQMIADATGASELENSLRDFLLSTSHDLRTPCHAIQASAMLLKQLPALAPDGEAQTLVSTVHAACNALNGVINNVLQLRRLERGAPLALAHRMFDPRTALAAAAHEAQTLFPSRQVHYMSACEGDAAAGNEARSCSAAGPGLELPTAVYGDGERLGECVSNVLLSGLRMSAWDADGPVRLDAACEEGWHDAHAAEDGRVTLRVWVDVPGRPLTEAECGALLAPFGLAPPDKGGVTGLALQVARGVARAMGGDVTLEPRGGRGGVTTRAVLRVQLRAAEHGAAPGAAPPPDSARQPSDRTVFPPPPGHAQQQQQQAEPPQQETAAAPPPAETPPPPSDAPMPPPEGELSNRMLECLMTTSDDIFTICQLLPAQPVPVFRILYTSPNVRRRLGYDAAALEGRNLLDIIHPEDRNAWAAAGATAVDGRLPVHPMLTYRRLTSDGGASWFDASGVVHAGLLYTVCRDVRARKATEASLRAFALATSHELREPCNAILVCASLLEQRGSVASDPDARFSLAAIRASCGLLLGIVTNVLTARQLEAGDIVLNVGAFSPAEVIEDVLQACRLGCPTAGAGGVAWVRSPGDMLPVMVEGDRHRLAQVVQNLVSNGCKFACGSRVELRAWLDAPDAHARPPPARAAEAPLPAEPMHWLFIRVSDSGRGMTAEQVATCFQAYAAAHPAQGGGTGLGLYISRKFAELMGGTLSCVSRPGVGTAFTLRVPVRVSTDAEAASAAADAAASAAAGLAERGAGSAAEVAALARTADVAHESSPRRAAAAAAAGSHRLRVLLADDSALNLRLLSRLLDVSGFAVTAVADGGAALAALRTSVAPGGAPFDVCVLDVEMPVLRGPAVAAAHREWERAAGAPRTPIVALTAHAMEAHAAECAAAGCDAFLSKPLRADAIAVLRTAATQAAEQRAIAASSPRGTKVV